MLPLELLDDALRAALREDLGTGDVTVDSLIPRDLLGRAEIIAREPLQVAGVEIAFRVFTLLSPSVCVVSRCEDGTAARLDEVLLRLEVVVRVAHRNAGSLGNGPHGGRRVALLLQQLEGRIEDLRPRQLGLLRAQRGR